MTPEPKCAVCGGAGRYVRDPKRGDPGAWCVEHAPAATSPWILIAQLLAILAIVALLAFKLPGWLRS
jgi:hypothetical protein